MNSLVKKSFAFFLLVTLTINTSFALGDDDGDKTFRFGIKVNPMLSWFRPDDKKIEKDGLKAKFGYGLITEFKLAKVVSFATGIGADYEGGKLAFKDSASYYVFDGEFISVADTAGKKVARYLLTSRNYNINYLNIPITLKMKTKDIGGMTYFAVFGGDLGFRLKSKVTDKVTAMSTVPAGFTYDPTDIDNTKDMNILRTALNVGAGFEYNLSGSTSLVVGLNYRRGFLPVVKKNSEYLLERNTSSAFKTAVLGDAFLLTAGILF
jgi:hypothetical protein